MGENESFIDYYQVLECERTAAEEEIKKNYQRLILIAHPDKKSVNNTKESFHVIQKAWSVLRDPHARRQYDAMLSCYESDELLLYDTITLPNMKFNTIDNVFSYECRCGGIYYLDSCEVITPQILIPCNECSFTILVNIPQTSQVQNHTNDISS